MKKRTLLLSMALMLGLTASAYTPQTDDSGEGVDSVEYMKAIEEQYLAQDDSLIYETGNIKLGTIAEMKVPAGYKYLNPEQSKYVLTELWGNPPQDNLGMLFPADQNPLDDDCWAIEISYQSDGHIDDDDAEDMNYDDLLKTMKTDQETANIQRKQMGLIEMHLTKWAEQPHYDDATKRIYWALDLAVDGDSAHTLNYNIRFLSRTGVLVMNAIGKMEQLPQIRKSTEPILSSVNFVEGQKYENFDSGVDKMAAYGVGGLVAGKVLAKVGAFALLAKFWKIIVAGIVAAGAAFVRLFKGKKKSDEEQVTPPTPPTYQP